MSSLLRGTVLAAAVLVLAAPAARAATWDIDPSHSQVGFVVKHLVVAKVGGVHPGARRRPCVAQGVRRV